MMGKSENLSPVLGPAEGQFESIRAASVKSNYRSLVLHAAIHPYGCTCGWGGYIFLGTALGPNRTGSGTAAGLIYCGRSAGEIAPCADGQATRVVEGASLTNQAVPDEDDFGANRMG